jgi:glycosyl transferase family 25
MIPAPMRVSAWHPSQRRTAMSTDRRTAFRLLNQAFEKVLVVTIPRARDRQALVAERLTGLELELANGVDKLEITLEGLEAEGLYSAARARKLDRHGKPMKLGQIAVSLSHRQIYERMVREGWKSALIMEDDVMPREEAIGGMAAVLSELPPAWECLYLGWFKHERVTPHLRAKQAFYLPLAALRLIRWTPRMVLNLYSRPCSPHLRRAGHHLGTHAYAITQAAAQKLLARQTPVAFPADQLLADQVQRGALAAYLAAPAVFDQGSVTGQMESLSRE